jgi:hypothetical protein
MLEPQDKEPPSRSSRFTSLFKKGMFVDRLEAGGKKEKLLLTGKYLRSGIP